MSCMNFQMIQVVIKCFERSTVERIDMSHCLSMWTRMQINTHKYGHGKMCVEQKVDK